MNIAMLSYHSCPDGELGASDTGGMSVYIRETALEIGKRGHRVDIFTRSHDPGNEPVVELGKNVRLIHIDAGERRRLPKSSLYSFLDEFIRGMEEFRKIAGIAYDLVHSHYWMSGCAGIRISKNWGIPHVITFHTLAAVKNAVSPAKPEPEVRLSSEKELIEKCDCIVMPTEREGSEAVNRYKANPGKISIIPCGVNLDVFRPIDKAAARQKTGINFEQNIILYVGRLDPLKGLDRLLKAGARLKDEIDFNILLVGGDDSPQPEQLRLHQLTHDLKLDDRVVFNGRAPQKDLPYYYSAADVFVLPSYYESFGMVALEALACGTPVAASDVGDLKRILSDEKIGSLVSGDMAASIADKINYYLKNKQNGDGQGIKARAAVKNYSWPGVTEALLDEYRNLIGMHDQVYALTDEFAACYSTRSCGRI